jgi:hypothetical protein
MPFCSGKRSEAERFGSYRFLKTQIDGHESLKPIISSISIHYSNASVSVCSPNLTQSPSENTYAVLSRDLPQHFIPLAFVLIED